jgi:hypothetical protein
MPTKELVLIAGKASVDKGRYHLNVPVDWKELFGRGNGWREPRLEEHQIRVSAEFISAMCSFLPEDVGWDGQDGQCDQMVALGTSDGVEVSSAEQFSRHGIHPEGFQDWLTHGHDMRACVD